VLLPLLWLSGTSTFLKIRWWVGTGLLATPTVVAQVWYRSPTPSAILPADAAVHIVVAWAVGGLMAYLADWYRRWVDPARLGSAQLNSAQLNSAQLC
jgi:hypothetical protein